MIKLTLTIDDGWPQVIVAGNPIDGISIHGPFESEEDATLWAEKNLSDQTWWMTDLEVPPEIQG